MARARSLKPGFHKNADLIALPPLTRILFAGLWTIADRDGRLEDRPKQIKIEVLPGDSCNIEIPTWKKHQNPHKDERPSIIPAPYEHSASTIQAPCKDSSNPADSLNLTPDSLIPDSFSSDCFNQSPVTVNPEPVTQHARSSTAVSVRGSCESDLFQEFIGVFIAAGVALNEEDVLLAGQGRFNSPGFLSFAEDEQRRIIAYALDQAKRSDAQYLGFPVNFLGKKGWTPTRADGFEREPIAMAHANNGRSGG
jgi:hypothetical protein